MTDLEITKLVAKAMGFIVGEAFPTYRGGPHILRVKDEQKGYSIPYDPLHDDAQAMALVKKFRLQIWTETAYWLVSEAGCADRWRAMNKDLNRAICECVAQIQEAKNKV